MILDLCIIRVTLPEPDTLLPTVPMKKAYSKMHLCVTLRHGRLREIVTVELVMREDIRHH